MRLVNSDETGEKMKTKEREEEEGCRTVCYSPARVAVYRLLSIAKKCRSSRSSSSRRDKFRVHVQDQPRELPSEIPNKSDDRRSRRINVSGLEGHETTFNLVAGLGFLSLIAASKTELDKTVELRKQMELYLQSYKDENQSKVTIPNQSDHEIAHAATTALDGLSNNFVEENQAPSVSQQESANPVAYDEHCNLHQTGALSEIMQEKVTEMKAENAVIGNNMSMMSSGEEIDSGYLDSNSKFFWGVPPLELERRLHELLEARQQERINELEALLEHTMKRLQEKETEAAWWKDTSKLISQQRTP